MKKGIRKVMLCKMGCGKQVKELWHKGKFKGYLRTCGSCKIIRSDDVKKSVSEKMSGMKHPCARPLFSTRLNKKKNGMVYREIKVNESGKWQYEHRYIMEKFLNKKLNTKEHVHHINGNTLDNRTENLIVLSHSEHMHKTALNNMKNKTGIFSNKLHRCSICGRLHRANK
jgi:hypothetical protein